MVACDPMHCFVAHQIKISLIDVTIHGLHNTEYSEFTITTNY